MRKLFFIGLALALVLCGCGARETLETIADDIPVESVLGQMREISVRLPDGAVSPVLKSEAEQLYLSEDYEILVQTCPAGNLNDTIRKLTGFDKEQLTVMETEQDGAKRYDFVWAAAGEDGERLGRAAILDDGSYHYCLSVERPADPEKVSQVVWSQVFSSFGLEPESSDPY